MSNLKSSKNQYRNISGIRFESYTSNPSDFKECKKECLLLKLKFRIIDGNFYKQVK